MTSGLEHIQALLALFAREGYVRAEPPVLQPAEPFLDLSGEDIRRRLFVTQGADGNEMCLRPEYTIPVCRLHIAGGAPERMASYAYAGPVFRQRPGETGEFPQAGIESIGRQDRAAADAEILSLALDALAALNAPASAVMIGDMGLLDTLAGALSLDGATKRRLLRAVAGGQGLATLDARENGNGGKADHAGLLAALEGQDPKAARAFVEDVLAIAGISRVGGRSASEIADRFLSRAARQSGSVPGEVRAVLERYLALEGDPDRVAMDLRALAADAGLAMNAAIDLFEERTGFMAARGLDVSRFRFSAGFARNLDYYTGFIFEVRGASAAPLAAGGRYDSLIAHLGAAQNVPAVGCAIWLDRVRTQTQSGAAA